MSAGDSHTCGIKANGTTFCWGYDAVRRDEREPSSHFPLTMGRDQHLVEERFTPDQC